MVIFVLRKSNILFMKRLLSLLGAVLLAEPVFSQNTLTIHQKDGKQFCFGFVDKPVITYTETDLVLKTTNTEVQYPLSSLAKFTFTDIEDAVISTKDDGKSAQLQLDNYVVSITGAKAGINVTVISSDGKTVGNYKTEADGKATFSIADLSQGIYIIKSP